MSNSQQDPIARFSNQWPLAKTSATALSVGLGLSLAAPSEAAVIYTDIPDVTISGGFFDIDLNGDALTDISIFHIPFGPGDAILFAYGYYGRIAVNLGTCYCTYASALTAGTTIDSSLLFDYYGYMGGIYPSEPAYGEWPGVSNRFLGINFFDDNNNEFFGWARLSVDASTLNATLCDFAYESTPGAGINAGAGGRSTACVAAATPEPGSLLLLAAGAIALLAGRRARRETLRKAA